MHKICKCAAYQQFSLVTQYFLTFPKLSWFWQPVNLFEDKKILIFVNKIFLCHHKNQLDKAVTMISELSFYQEMRGQKKKNLKKKENHQNTLNCDSKKKDSRHFVFLSQTMYFTYPKDWDRYIVLEKKIIPKHKIVTVFWFLQENIYCWVLIRSASWRHFWWVPINMFLCGYPLLHEARQADLGAHCVNPYQTVP